MARVFVGIGSNLSDRRAMLELARQGLAALPQSKLVGYSEVYETDPVGPVLQDKFLNAAAELSTSIEPQELLARLCAIEHEAGRSPTEQRVKWGPRTLDLDILLYDDMVLSMDDLVIPHPMMHERWFVLKPLADLDPGVIHPLLEMTVGELLKYVEQQAEEMRSEHENPGVQELGSSQ